jgi:hypothetical protein
MLGAAISLLHAISKEAMWIRASIAAFSVLPVCRPRLNQLTCETLDCPGE